METGWKEAGESRDRFVPPKGDVRFINNLPSELLCRIFRFSCANGYGPMTTAAATKLASIRRHYAKWVRQIQGDTDVEGKPRSGSEGEGIKEREEADDVDNSNRVTLYGFHHFQFIISFVCRRWRDIALSTPSVWSDIQVYPIKGQSFKLESLMLERSRDLPIDIRVDCRSHELYVDGVRPPSKAELMPLLRMLASNVHRWRTMIVDASEIYGLMKVFLDAVSDPTISSASQLETLELYYEDMSEWNRPSTWYDPTPEYVTLFGGSAPLLTKLVLSGIHVDWDQPWIASAPNIQDLELSCHAGDVRPSWAQFTTILRGASALRRLVLHESGPSEHPASWFVEDTPGSVADLNAPVVLARVTELTLMWLSQARPLGLLRKLRFPALKNLILNLWNADYTDLVHELARQSPSSACEKTGSLLSRLESLHIQHLQCCSVEAVETMYGELQNLTSLTIDTHSLHPRFLDILATRLTSSGLSHLSAIGASDRSVPSEVIDPDGSDEDDDEWTDVDEDSCTST